MSILKLSDFYLDGSGCEKNRIKAYTFLLVAELYADKETFLFKHVENKKKVIALSDVEKEQASIEFKLLKNDFLKT